MAVKPRLGSQTWFAAGRNATRGTPLANLDAIQVKRRFPFTEFSINDDPQIIESTLIRALGAASADIFGLFSAAGRIRTGIVPIDALHLLRGVLNPTSISSTKITGVNNKSTPDDAAINASTSFGTIAADAKHPIADGKPPSKLKLTLDTAATKGNVIVTGIRKVGRPNNRIHKVTDIETIAGTGTSLVTKKSWVDITKVENSGLDSGVTSFTGEWDPDGYETIMKFNTTNSLFEGWTVVGADGGVPFVAEDVTPISARFNVTSGGATFDMDVIATLKNELRKLGSDDEALKYTDEEIAKFPLSPDREQPGWGNSLFFGDRAVKATGLDLAITLNIAPDTEVFEASRYATDIIQTANRTVIFSPTLRFVSGDEKADVFNRWQHILRGDIRSALIFRSYNYLGDGSRTLFEIKAPSAQMNANEVVTSGAGPLTRRTGFKALPSSGEVSEIVVRTETKGQFTDGG